MSRVVTISAAYGAGGSEIAPAVARRLGARFVDRAIPVDVAERLAVPLDDAFAHDEAVGGLFARMVSGLAAAGGVYGPGPVEPVPAPPERFQQETERCIREAAGSGAAVILGRAGALVLRDERGVLPVSTMMRGQYGLEGVYLSVPCVVGRRGVERVIEIPLDESERAGLHATAELLRRTHDGLRGVGGKASGSTHG